MSVRGQNMAILKHLMECKPITPLEAMHLYRSMRLGARIWDLRSPKYGSHPIKKRMKRMSSGKYVAEYYYDFSDQNPAPQAGPALTAPPSPEGRVAELAAAGPESAT